MLLDEARAGLLRPHSLENIDDAVKDSKTQAERIHITYTIHTVTGVSVKTIYHVVKEG
jgi:hypothetical protein